MINNVHTMNMSDISDDDDLLSLHWSGAEQTGTG